MGVLGPYELVDLVPIDVRSFGAPARLKVMGDSGCGGKASLAQGAGHLFPSMDARLEMLRLVTRKANPQTKREVGTNHLDTVIAAE